jgi:uncharacterized protein (DUF1778 family)
MKSVWLSNISIRCIDIQTTRNKITFEDMPVKKQTKTEQLQVRLTPAQKRALKTQAKRKGMTVSDWVLKCALSSARTNFEELVGDLSTAENPSYTFAELLDLLAPLTRSEFRTSVAELPSVALEPYWENYLAATVEQAAAQKNVPPPEWTTKIQPLEEPVFGSTLRSLREHLLFNAPPAFRRRNIFIDAAVGARV